MEDCAFTRHKPYYDQHQDNMTSTSDNTSPKMFIADEKLADILISKYDYLDSCITNENFGSSLNSNLVLLLKFILENGSYLDSDLNYKEQIDMFFSLFRNLLRNHLNCLPDSINLLILRLIEIRASKWKIKSSIEEYYRKKIDNSFKQNLTNLPATRFHRNEIQENIPLASSGLRASKSYGDLMNNCVSDGLINRNTKPVKVNKGVVKDEVVIKNSDSGKVMGIKGRRVHMIEEMSDTIISFQKAIPGVKERLVQITGHSKECIDKAKSLIDVTIKQNTSPIPFNETNDNNSDNCCQFEEELFATTSQYNITPSSVSSAASNFETNDGENGYQMHNIKLSLANKEVDIQVSDKSIGLKLEHFVNRYNFVDFIQNEQNAACHKNIISIDGDSIACHDDNANKCKDHLTPTIEYDRNFLFSLKEHAEKNSLRVINDIKQKDRSLYRS